MEGFLGFVGVTSAIVAVLAVLDMAVLRWGADSRPLGREGPDWKIGGN
jgi:hypothetical protein